MEAYAAVMHVSLLAVICGGAVSCKELWFGTQHHMTDVHDTGQNLHCNLGKQIVVPAIENLGADCFSSACNLKVKLPCLVPYSAQQAQQARSGALVVALPGPQLQLQ